MARLDGSGEDRTPKSSQHRPVSPQALIRKRQKQSCDLDGPDRVLERLLKTKAQRVVVPLSTKVT